MSDPPAAELHAAPSEPASLWRELADGSAGPAVRACVSLALAPLLAGVALVGSFVLSGMLRLTDELIVGMLLLGSVGYLSALFWIWVPRRYRLREFWKAVLLTVVVTVGAVLLGWFIDEIVSRDDEVLLMGVACISTAAVILIWLQAARRFVRRKPLRNATDGAVDLHCPSCGYRMVGLYESRCPECGTAYTLDELLARQEFFVRRPPLETLAPETLPAAQQREHDIPAGAVLK